MSNIQLLQGSKEDRGRVRGVAVGIVTNNKDPEVLARVKVRFPWREDQESHWARTAVPMAGAGRGTYFLPEVGDEVLIAFDQGDIRLPYVIGALWNGLDIPPEANADGENNIRGITSRSGHHLVFDDTAGSEKVEIISKSGHRICLDDSAGTEKIEIRDACGSNRVIIDSDPGSIEIESARAIKLSSPTIDIEADVSINIKAGGTVMINDAAV